MNVPLFVVSLVCLVLGLGTLTVGVVVPTLRHRKRERCLANIARLERELGIAKRAPLPPRAQAWVDYMNAVRR